MALLFSSGCCPIPWPTTVTVTPAVAVTVTAEGSALAGADVVLARYEYHPHFAPERGARKAQGRTDDQGRFAFELVEETETSMPLMMHGVAGYGWQLCAEATGYRAALYGLPWDLAPNSTIALDLTPGDGAPCSELLGRDRLDAGLVVPPTPVPQDEPVHVAPPSPDAGEDTSIAVELPPALRAATRVVVYSFDMCEAGEGFCDGRELSFPIGIDGQVRSRESVIAKRPTTEQFTRLWAALTSPASYGGEVSACFFPRHAVAFFDAKDELVGQIAICFECNQVEAMPRLEGVPAVEDAREHGDAVMSGFSEAGVAELLKICEELGLGHCEPSAP